MDIIENNSCKFLVNQNLTGIFQGTNVLYSVEFSKVKTFCFVELCKVKTFHVLYNIPW